MKNHVLNYLALSIALFTLMFTSCRKPEIPKDPCKNAVNVTALSSDQFEFGHFLLQNQNGSTYLYANNYHAYASKIAEGGQYLLGYKAVPCFQNKTQDCGIREGGCIVTTECIEITCLREVSRTCNSSIVDPADYDDKMINGFNSAYIEGNTLYATIGYSGCSENDNSYFSLYLRENLLRCPPVNSGVFEAKITDSRTGFICQAYFTKKTCFDLNPIKTYYKNNNVPMPDEVTINLRNGNDVQDLVYKLR